MQRVYEENEWGKVSKRIITIPLSIFQGSQRCTIGIIKTFTCCILAFFISGSSTPNYTLLSLLVIKLLFLSAVNNVVTILFMYSTSYFIAICSMGRVTLVPNSPLNGWERDGDWIVEGLKGHRWCSALMSECGLWVSLFNLTVMILLLTFPHLVSIANNQNKHIYIYIYLRFILIYTIQMLQILRKQK